MVLSDIRLQIRYTYEIQTNEHIAMNAYIFYMAYLLHIRMKRMPMTRISEAKDLG